MYILGLSCFYHDSAACLLKNGVPIAAADEQTFTRKKHDNSFPRNSIRWALDKAGISMDDVKAVAFYEKPLVKFERIIKSHLANFPKSFNSKGTGGEEYDAVVGVGSQPCTSLMNRLLLLERVRLLLWRLPD